MRCRSWVERPVAPAPKARVRTDPIVFGRFHHAAAPKAYAAAGLYGPFLSMNAGGIAPVSR
jgi:hypothetical protein